MYIKSMVIDGFKSYGQRTEITGFDRLFNAITGLNGSGKSNILDSICFLLGITNLSQVRASNLQELVYKNGQAGVTKATVSITFDNHDKNQCPVGYENYDEITVTRQVVIGGRNKYLINGCNAQNNRVQDLFGSVQLNVNNPHFLIMQGRITKVLNMKPAEILSMIEEAAGTRMYESKKQAAERTIEKKDAKLTEINKLLNEEITPTLKRLKTERQAYMDFTKIVRELEHLTKLDIAWQYRQQEENCQQSADKYDALQKSIEQLQKTITECEAEKEQLDKSISSMEKRKDEELGGKLQELEEVLREQQMAETKANLDLKHFKDNLKEEIKRKKELEKNINEDKTTVNAKTKELENLLNECKDIIEKGKSDSEALEAAKQHFKAVSSGLSSNTDGEEATLAEQLMAAKKEIADSETEIKQAEMRLKHASTEMSKRRDEMKKAESSFKRDESTLTALVKELGKLQNQLAGIQYEEGRDEQIAQEKLNLQREIRRDQDSIDAFEARFPNLSFNYQDPEPGFDRRKVHGLVCKLIDLKRPETARALEVAAGGRLYNVVVDNEVVGKKLLDKGRLRQRVTIIPLNKIANSCIDRNIIQKAKHIVGEENVDLALSLVGYPSEIEAAMKYVFGGTFICPNMNAAKTLAFNRDVNKRSVTLDGDVFEPAGTLTGGSRQSDQSVLAHLSRIHELQNTLNEKKDVLSKLEREHLALKNSRDQYHALKQKVDPKEEEVALIRARLQMCSYNQQLEELKTLEANVNVEKELIKKANENKQKKQGKAKELELKIKDSKKYREQELKAAEAQLAKCKKDFESSSKLSKVKEQEADSLKLEIEELNKSLTAYTEQLQEVEKVVANISQRIEDLENKLKEAKDEVQKASNNVKAQKDELKAQTDEINQLQKKWNKSDKEINKCKLQIQQLEHDSKKCKDEAKEAKDRIKNLGNKYEWIQNEKQFFGAPNTEYDFQAIDMKEARQRIQKLNEKKESLSKSVNMRAQNMMIQTEEQYQDLLNKKQIVENDKSKISKVIEELDIKKKLALKDAWEKVNKDFGSIYSLLLPGTQAKLVPPEGMSCTDGLEIKVAFGNVWKESLNELSGGQRSLVALSLILSLLLFKPAPIYILDEVDAALDLSHTQNIGQMLRTHFKHSQFIIVSLKDGMFNNANVLFKTKFIDGVSTVTRHTQQNK